MADVVTVPVPKVAKDKVAKGKSVTLTFLTEDEIAVHDALAEDAEADDRTLSKFIVRYLKAEYSSGK